MIIAKGFLKLPNMFMPIQHIILSLPRNLTLATFSEWLSVLKKGKSVIPSASNIAKLFTGNFPMNSNLVYSGFSLPAVPSRTKWKLCNVYASPKLVGRSHLQSLYLWLKTTTLLVFFL